MSLSPTAHAGARRPRRPAPGTLTINGNLTLDAGSILNFDFGQANVAGGPLNDLVNVGGDLTLDGTLNVSPSAGGSFGPGIYRVFNYGGALTDNGLTIGTIPSPSFFVQTSVANQVNLVNTAGLTLTSGTAPGRRMTASINGGDGIWQSSAGNDNWTTITGAFNAPCDEASLRDLQRRRRHRHGRQQPRRGQRRGHAVRRDGYHLPGDAIALDRRAGSIDPRRRRHGGRCRLYRDDRRRADRHRASW